MSKHAQGKGRIPSGKIRRLVLISIVVAVFALGAMATVSLRGQAKASRPQTGSSPTNDARANLRFRAGAPIPLDPQTGQVRPLTQQEAERLAAEIKQLVNQSTDGLRSVRHPNGSVSMDLQGRFQNIAVAKLDTDGKLVQSCIDNPESAAAFFSIDPQLVGLKKNASASPTSNATLKGGLR
ncbi:MAG: post-PEP-CTERM-1 domain-containing protein [Pyrinomonadaceae bacterium]